MKDITQKLLKISSILRMASDSAKIKAIVQEFDPSINAAAQEAKVLSASNVIHHMRGEKKYLGV